MALEIPFIVYERGPFIWPMEFLFDVCKQTGSFVYLFLTKSCSFASKSLIGTWSWGFLMKHSEITKRKMFTWHTWTEPLNEIKQIIQIIMNIRINRFHIRICSLSSFTFESSAIKSKWELAGKNVSYIKVMVNVEENFEVNQFRVNF